MAISLLERHLHEASFAFSQRELCAAAPHHDARSLGELDANLEAHLDGLRLGGDAAWEICRAALPDGDAGVTFAAAELALSRGELRRFAEVLAIASVDAALAEGVRGALAWVPVERARPALERLLSPDVPPAAQRIGLGACADRRLDPKDALDRCLRAEDRALRASALVAAGVLGDPRRAPAVREDLGHADRRCRAAAAWAGALLRDPAAEALLPETALRGAALDGACELLALLEEPTRPARDLSALPPRIAARYAGASGDAHHVPWLLERLADASIARAAGEALTSITGADMSRPPLRGAPPPGFAAGPSDDPADPSVAMDPDEDIPWPHGENVRTWWRARAPGSGARRTLLGEARTDAWLEQVLRRGRQRHRAIAAIALKLRRPGRPLFNVRAPSFRQAKALATT
jgi:uncharacterized protein (TIGR02270 family)